LQQTQTISENQASRSLCQVSWQQRGATPPSLYNASKADHLKQFRLQQRVRDRRSIRQNMVEKPIQTYGAGMVGWKAYKNIWLWACFVEKPPSPKTMSLLPCFKRQHAQSSSHKPVCSGVTFGKLTCCFAKASRSLTVRL